MGLGFDGAALQGPLRRDESRVCVCVSFSDVTLYRFRLISPIHREAETENRKHRESK